MKITSLAGIVFLAGSGALMAQDAIDANGDEQITMDELVAVFPDVSAEVFSEADADASGTLDAAELAAAQEAGTIPAEM